VKRQRTGRLATRGLRSASAASPGVVAGVIGRKKFIYDL
jgi:hypothetical protein